LQFYNDYGYLEKLNSDFNDTAMNVTGVLVSAGSVYTYFDIAGKDQPWLGPNWTNGLAGSDAKWEVRFNMNIVLLLDLFSYLRKKTIFIW
jgi:hypothetical protein